MAERLSDIKQLQLAFWAEFSRSFDSLVLPRPKPGAKNWCYLSIGIRGVRIILTMLVDDGEVGCKLDVRDAAHQGAVIAALTRDRPAIEAELGFFDLTWWTPKPTRVYRSSTAVVANREEWPQAFRWLLTNAERFREVFGPRIERAQASATGGRELAQQSPQTQERWTHKASRQRSAHERRPSQKPASGCEFPCAITDDDIEALSARLGTLLSPAGILGVTAVPRAHS
jgi:hypothetical protein